MAPAPSFLGFLHRPPSPEVRIMRKEQVLQVLDALPDDVDVDALMERLCLLRKIEVAERQIARGEGVSHEDATKRLAQGLE
jgi:hypothetical protein